MLVGSDDTLTVWLNGKKVYNHRRRGYNPGGRPRVEIKLRKGTNRLVIKCGNSGRPLAFAVAVTVPGDYAFLKAPDLGRRSTPTLPRRSPSKARANPAHGRGPVLRPEGAGLHQVPHRGQGGGHGRTRAVDRRRQVPARRADHLGPVSPRPTIFSGYEPVVVATADGRVLTGIVKNETPEVLEIEDADAKRVKVAKADIDERKPSDVSLMPNGLADGLSRQDFADLIAYLETLKEVAPRHHPRAEGTGEIFRNPKNGNLSRVITSGWLGASA